jgi:SAP domain
MPTSASTGTGQVSTGGGSPDQDDYDGMTKEQLQEELRARELPVSGNVDELRARLRDYDNEPEASDTEPEPDDAPEQPPANPPEETRTPAEMGVAPTVEDIEKAKEESEVETVANTEVIASDSTERNTPDGAPVVTREEDVVGGVRVDLPPSAPAAYRPPLADPNRAGIVQATRPDGSQVLVDANQPGWEERKRRIEAGEINN